MNKLSLMLWLSDVSQSIGVIAGILGVVAAIAAVIFTACFVISTIDEYETGMKMCSIFAWRLWPLAAVFLVLSIVTPSKNTVMMVAASEAASTVAATPAAQEIMNDSIAVMRQWLKSQIKDEKK